MDKSRRRTLDLTMLLITLWLVAVTLVKRANLGSVDSQISRTPLPNDSVLTSTSSAPGFLTLAAVGWNSFQRRPLHAGAQDR